MSERDHKIVKIVGDDVEWSLDNGFTISRFKQGEVYSVPDYVASGMIRRKVAKALTQEEIETQDSADTEIQLSELRGKKRKD